MDLTLPGQNGWAASPEVGIPHGCGIQFISSFTRDKLIWLVVSNIFIFHNIWDNPSHWLIFFRGVETTNQWWLTCGFQGAIFSDNPRDGTSLPRQVIKIDVESGEYVPWPYAVFERGMVKNLLDLLGTNLSDNPSVCRDLGSDSVDFHTLPEVWWSFRVFFLGVKDVKQDRTSGGIWKSTGLGIELFADNTPNLIYDGIAEAMLNLTPCASSQ